MATITDGPCAVGLGFSTVLSKRRSMHDYVYPLIGALKHGILAKSNCKCILIRQKFFRQTSETPYSPIFYRLSFYYMVVT